MPRLAIRRQFDRALVYATYNGVYNNTNGIGRQTKTMLSTLARHYVRWSDELGGFDFHLIAPLPLQAHWGYSRTDLSYAATVTHSAGGRVHYCPLPTGASDFWSRPTWEALSTSCGAVVCELAQHYRELLVLAVDTPYLGVGHVLRDVGVTLNVRLDVLLLFYSTSLIVDRVQPTPKRHEWEQAAVAAVNRSDTVRVGDVGDYMTRHLVDDYRLEVDRLVPFPSSLDAHHDEFLPMPIGDARATVSSHGVPVDRPIVLAFGRADAIKGFDILIRALAPLRDQAHLVLIAVPYSPDDPILATYTQLIRATGVRATCLWQYDRDLPRSLCQIPETRVVACPSLGESLSNVPFEVSLWARHRGPVLVCPAADGYAEQVADAVTGFTYVREDGPEALTMAIRRALRTESDVLDQMRQAAYEQVMEKRDSRLNVLSTLRHYWS
jgi:glycosyltransferase involved in cell wall biosynthesis